MCRYVLVALLTVVVTVRIPPLIVIICIITILEVTREAAGVKMSLPIVTYPPVLVFVLLITLTRLMFVYVCPKTTSIKVTDPKLVVGTRAKLIVDFKAFVLLYLNY